MPLNHIVTFSFNKIEYAFDYCINVFFGNLGLSKKRNTNMDIDYQFLPSDDFKILDYVNSNRLCKKISYLIYLGMAYRCLPYISILKYFYGDIEFKVLYDELKDKTYNSLDGIQFWSLRNKTLTINLNKPKEHNNMKASSTNDNPDSFESIALSQIELYKKKNSDYGSATDKLFQKHGFEYYQIMLEQKMQRIDSLTKKDNQHNFESLEDTLLDLSNYAILAVESLRKQKKDNPPLSESLKKLQDADCALSLKKSINLGNAKNDIDIKSSIPPVMF